MPALPQLPVADQALKENKGIFNYVLHYLGKSHVDQNFYMHNNNIFNIVILFLIMPGIVDMSSGSTDGDLCPPPAKKSAIEQLLGDVYIVSVSAAKTIEERVKSELETYKAKASIPLSSCPLLWWRTSEESFPLLAKLAKRVLGIPSTSVASEKVFSTAGDIITATRSAINPDNVDRLIFLKRNL